MTPPIIAPAMNSLASARAVLEVETVAGIATASIMAASVDFLKNVFMIYKLFLYRYIYLAFASTIKKLAVIFSFGCVMYHKT